MLLIVELDPCQARDRRWESRTFRGAGISPCHTVQPDLVVQLITVVKRLDRCRALDRRWESRTWQGDEGPFPKLRPGLALRAVMVEDLRFCRDPGREWEERTWRQRGERKPSLLFFSRVVTVSFVQLLAGSDVMH